MRVAIRVDASRKIGSGHVRRCVALATALKAMNADVRFIVRREDGVAPALLDQEIGVIWLEPQAGLSLEADAAATAMALAGWRTDWIVVDHYGIDAGWHESVRAATAARILAIDDLADRPLSPDMLVDPNLQPDHQKYGNTLLKPARQLTGPRFALLAASYAHARRHVVGPHVRSIGIFMGGTDPTGACLDALRACRSDVGYAGPIEVVSSPVGQHYAALADWCNHDHTTRLIDGLPDLADFFARHDLHVGAGGGAVWERCCIGAPTVACVVASNQMATLPLLEARGAVVWARGEPDLRAAIAREVRSLLSDVARRQALARSSLTLVDGLGATRVAAAMAGIVGEGLAARPACPADESLLLAWANDPQVRCQAFNPAAIDPSRHGAWFGRRLDDPENFRISIVEAGAGIPVGQVRLERDGRGWEISYSLSASFRGLGLGAAVLSAGIPEDLSAAPLLGRVKPGNLISARVFRRLGFSEHQACDERGEHLLFIRSPNDKSPD